jgi:hypothetical protein
MVVVERLEKVSGSGRFGLGSLLHRGLLERSWFQALLGHLEEF